MNAQNKFGETPLHKSIFNNSVRLLMVNLLLQAGADVNLLSTRGESCLHFAVHLGREDLVSVLIKVHFLALIGFSSQDQPLYRQGRI